MSIKQVSLRRAGAITLFGQSNLPLILVSSGSIGNNGALTGATTLPATYAASYVYLPTGAIAAASVAGWYYAVWSSATACTVYNNTYSSGTPTIPASPTAFVTTGPGAYTQTITSDIEAYNISLPAGMLGIDDALVFSYDSSINTSVNNKIVKQKIGAVTISTVTVTAVVDAGVTANIANRQSLSSQIVGITSYTGVAGSAVAPSYAAVNFANANTAQVSAQLATATDFVVFERVSLQAILAVP